MQASKTLRMASLPPLPPSPLFNSKWESHPTPPHIPSWTITLYLLTPTNIPLFQILKFTTILLLNLHSHKFYYLTCFGHGFAWIWPGYGKWRRAWRNISHGLDNILSEEQIRPWLSSQNRIEHLNRHFNSNHNHHHSHPRPLQHHHHHTTISPKSSCCYHYSLSSSLP